MRTSLFYQDDRQKSELCYIGSVTRDHPMNIWEMLDIAGVSMDDFSAEQGWDGWNPEQILSIDGADVENLESGDLVPEAYFCFVTPNGGRFIRIPKVIDDLWECVHIVDSRLYDVLDPADVIETVEQRPGYPEYCEEDMIWQFYAILKGPEGFEETVSTYNVNDIQLSEVLGKAEFVYSRMSDEEKKKENVLVCRMREDVLFPNSEILQYYSLNGVRLSHSLGNPLAVPSRWGVVSVAGDEIMSWGVGDDEKAIFSSYAEALEFLNSCDDIEREDYYVKMVI